MVWVLNLVATFQILLVTLVPSQTLSTRKSTAKWSWRAKDSKSSKSRGFKRGKWASDFKILTLPNSARPIGIYQNAVSMWTDWSSRVLITFYRGCATWLVDITPSFQCYVQSLWLPSKTWRDHTHFIRGRLVKRLLFIFALDILWRSMASCFPTLFESKSPSGKSPRPFQAGHWPLPMELIPTQCDIFLCKNAEYLKIQRGFRTSHDKSLWQVPRMPPSQDKFAELLWLQPSPCKAPDSLLARLIFWKQNGVFDM